MSKSAKKNSKKKIPGTPKKERYFGIILEDINGKIKQIFEGQDAIKKELKSEISGVKSELKSEISGVKSELNEFKKETRSNFQTVFKYLSRIDDELQTIKKEISELKSRLIQKADLERLLNLEKRVKDIETTLAKVK